MAGNEAVAPEVEPTESDDIGLGQLAVLSSLRPAARLAVVAEGLPIILASAEDLAAASKALRGPHPRAADVLERQAHEEAAKILILLDYVRCPLGLSKRAQEMIKAFYDHGARAIYAEACHWTAYDVEMLRGYVDRTRASHFVEGDFGQWIIPNWDGYKREALLYADLNRANSGALSWSDPRDWRQERLLPRFESPILRLVRALGRLGFYNKQALQIFADIWRPHEFLSAEQGSELADQLTQKTLAALIDKKLVNEEATDADVGTVYNSWPLPMYAIDVRKRKVPLEELRAEQDAQFYSAAG